MSVKYKGFTLTENKGTEFGKPTFVKYGKEIDIQEYIEASREDTEIYPTLLKYGTLKPLQKSYEAIYGDFTEYNDFRTLNDKAIQANKMWDELPTDIKHEFNNDKNEFIDRGMEWAKNQIEKQTQAVIETPAEPKGE